MSYQILSLNLKVIQLQLNHRHKQVRNFVLAQDLAQAIYLVLANPSVSNHKVYNVCSDMSLSVLDLIEIISIRIRTHPSITTTAHLSSDIMTNTGSHKLLPRAWLYPI